MVGSGRSPRFRHFARTVALVVALAGAATARGEPHFVPAPGSPYATDNEPGSALPGAFNGDALTDIAVVNGSSSTLQFFDQIAGNNGFGFDAASSFGVVSGPSVSAVADFDGVNGPD